MTRFKSKGFWVNVISNVISSLIEESASREVLEEDIKESPIKESPIKVTIALMEKSTPKMRKVFIALLLSVLVPAWLKSEYLELYIAGFVISLLIIAFHTYFSGSRKRKK